MRADRPGQNRESLDVNLDLETEAVDCKKEKVHSQPEFHHNSGKRRPQDEGGEGRNEGYGQEGIGGGQGIDSPSHADLVLLHPILTLNISIRSGHEALIPSSLGLVADTTSERRRAGKRKKMTCSVSEKEGWEDRAHKLASGKSRRAGKHRVEERSVLTACIRWG